MGGDGRAGLCVERRLGRRGGDRRYALICVVWAAR